MPCRSSTHLPARLALVARGWRMPVGGTRQLPAVADASRALRRRPDLPGRPRRIDPPRPDVPLLAGHGGMGQLSASDLRAIACPSGAAAAEQWRRTRAEKWIRQCAAVRRQRTSQPQWSAGPVQRQARQERQERQERQRAKQGRVRIRGIDHDRSEDRPQDDDQHRQRSEDRRHQANRDDRGQKRQGCVDVFGGCPAQQRFATRQRQERQTE